MRSIRRGIPSGRHGAVDINIPFSRYISGTSFGNVTLSQPSPSISRKGKEKATEPESKPRELGSLPDTSEPGADYGSSEYDVITGPLDSNYPPPEKIRAKPQCMPRNHHRKSLFSRFREMEALAEKNPPLPAIDRWKKNKKLLSRARPLGGPLSLRRLPQVPIPLTYGSGGVEGRVQWCQQVMKERKENLRAVIATLAGPEHLSGRELAVAKNGDKVAMDCSTKLLGQGQLGHASESSSFIVCDDWRASRSLGCSLASQNSRAFSMSASTNESTDSPGPPVTLGHKPGKPNRADSHRQANENLITNSSISDQVHFHPAGGFSTSWPREKWQETWGTDELAPPNNRQCPQSFISVLTALKKHQSKPWKSRSVVGHSSSRPRRLSLSRRLLRMRRKWQKNSTAKHRAATRSLQSENSFEEVSDSSQRTTDVTDVQMTQTANAHPARKTKQFSHYGRRGAFHTPSPPTRRNEQPTSTNEVYPASSSVEEPAILSCSPPSIREFVRTFNLRNKAKGYMQKTLPKNISQTVMIKRGRKFMSVRKPIKEGTIGQLPRDVKILEDVEPPGGLRAIPRLAHGLDRVLFNPSVHWVQDPHSRVYNFPPNVQSLPAVTEFAFERIGSFISSSRDESLHSLAFQHHKRFVGSTSSLTGFLAHIYFLISGDRAVDTSTLSTAFVKEPRTFTPGIRIAASAIFNHRRCHLNEEGGVTSDTRNSKNLFDHLQNLLRRRTDMEEIQATARASGSEVERSDRKDSTASDPDLEDTPRNTSGELDSNFHVATSMPSPPPEDGPPVEASSVTSPKTVSTDSASGQEGGKTVDSSRQEGVGAAEPSERHPNRRKYFDTYAIDNKMADPDARRQEELNLLMWIGTMTEKFLTLPEPEFKALLRSHPADVSQVEPTRLESYRYAKSSQFVMRSQLDCQDTRLPGTGIFDIKTRAVLPVRLDQLNYQENAGYLIRTLTGLYESFEREYYDLIRSAFLKYTFQARIGNMDGVFVAYHNTSRMFGFQYVPVAEMEARLYGPGRPGRGAMIFEKCIRLLEIICDEVAACYPTETVNCTMEAREGQGGLMVWIVPLNRPEPKPITELFVTVEHTLNKDPVSSSTAIDRADEDWDLHYSITRRSKNREKIWARLKEVASRGFSSILPQGVSAETMAERLALVDFSAGRGLDQVFPEGLGAAPDESESESKIKFSKASRRVKLLRRLAKQGWADRLREEKAAAHRVVWGIDNDADDGPGVEGGGGGRGLGGAEKIIQETSDTSANTIHDQEHWTEIFAKYHL